MRRCRRRAPPGCARAPPRRWRRRARARAEADQIAGAGFGRGERTGAIEPVAGLMGQLGRARRESVVDIGAMGVGELERVRRDTRLPYHVADKGRRPRRIDDRRAQGRLAQDFARRRIGHRFGGAQELAGAGSATRSAACVSLRRARGVAIAAHLELVRRCRRRTAPASISSPATSRDGRGSPAGRHRRPPRAPPRSGRSGTAGRWNRSDGRRSW